MKRIFTTIILIVLLVAVAFGLYYNETRASYYLIGTDLEYDILYVRENQQPLEDIKDLEKTGVKKDVFFKYNDGDIPFASGGKTTIYKNTKGLILPRYYAKVRPFSRLGLRIYWANRGADTN